jgi:hypothetical protein
MAGSDRLTSEYGPAGRAAEAEPGPTEVREVRDGPPAAKGSERNRRTCLQCWRD